ncbi:MAG: hypothetical protein QXS21_05510 [Thermoproteota archaeon]
MNEDKITEELCSKGGEVRKTIVKALKDMEEKPPLVSVIFALATIITQLTEIVFSEGTEFEMEFVRKVYNTMNELWMKIALGGDAEE